MDWETSKNWKATSLTCSRGYQPAALGFFRLWPFCDRPHIIGHRHRRSVAMFSFCNDKPIGRWVLPIRSHRANSKRYRAAIGKKRALARGKHDSLKRTDTRPCRNKVTFPLSNITYCGIKASPGHGAILAPPIKREKEKKREKEREKERETGLETRSVRKARNLCYDFELTHTACSMEPVSPNVARRWPRINSKM